MAREPGWTDAGDEAAGDVVAAPPGSWPPATGHPLLMRNRYVFSSCALLFALHATGCGANPDPAAPTPNGEVSAPAPTPFPEPEGTPEPTPSVNEPPAPAVPAPDPTTPTGPAVPAVPGAPPETTPPPAPSGADGFGVTMLYPSKAGGEAWALAENATADTRFVPQGSITRNADGSWKMKSSQVRMSAYPSTGYDAKQIATYDRDVLASRGYMQAANDWKNVEMTGFVKVNAASNTQDNFAWYARGGKHNDDHSGCEGSSYKGGLHYDGRVRFEKETWHVSYDQGPYQPATSALQGRWVGFKSVMRNVPGANGAEAVKLELYVNENADKVTWKKVYDLTDAGTWGGDAQHCGGSVGAMPITWGGPIATFRWDNAQDVDFKWLSVREIQP